MNLSSINSKNYRMLSWVAIAVFCAVVISLALVSRVSGDACWHLSAAKFMASNGKIPVFEEIGRDEPFWSPPMYHFVAAFFYFIFSYFGNSAGEVSMKLVSPLFGIGSVIMSYLLIRKPYGEKIGFYSVIFLSFVPIFIDYSYLGYVEMSLVFFSVLGIYFALSGRAVLSGIFAGLAILSKYNGFFAVPVIAFILFKNKTSLNDFLKKITAVALVSLVIAGPWLIRNWMEFGNPIWPFLNFVFGGIELKSYSGLLVSRLFHYNTIIFSYLAVFGVPNGDYRILGFFGSNIIKILIPIWLAATAFIVFPFVLGFKKAKKTALLWAWIAPFIFLFCIYVMNVGWAVTRIVLPAFPALAVFWAVGFEKIIRRKKALAMIIACSLLAVLGAEMAKVGLAANAWKAYDSDFEWVHKNTKSSDSFAANGQCVTFNLDRKSYYLTDKSIKDADYIWMNQRFKLDSRSIYNKNELSILENANTNIAYSNEKTGTVIYKINK